MSNSVAVYDVSGMLGSKVYHLNDPNRSQVDRWTGGEFPIMLCGLDGYEMVSLGDEQHALALNLRLCIRCEARRAALAGKENGNG